MSDERKYNFNDTDDMIELAKFIACEVYWHSSFIDSAEDEDGADPISYRHLWDYIEAAHHDGFKGIIITDDGYVRFTN